MAAPGAKDKASASVASDDESTIKVAPKKEIKDKALGNIKLKKPAPKHSKPGNWREGSIIDEAKKNGKGAETPSTNSVGSPGVLVNMLDDSARETFPTGRPLEDEPDHVQCKHCKKSVLKTAVKGHITACLKAKRERAQRKKEQKEARDREKKGITVELKKDGDGDTKMDDDDDDDDDESPEKKGPGGVKSAKKSAGKNIDETKKGKKRKADGDAEKGPKLKKKKEEPKPKMPKPKGPVDVERQCGVLKDGVPCARSLTCKSHSMGAKRAVPGRTLPYDMLLSQYQKKNQAKQQKAAIDANAPLEDEDANNGPIDSDEELAAVQQGLAKWDPQPLVLPAVQMPIQLQYRNQRLYEQLHSATNGFTINICKVEGYGAQKLPPGHPGLHDGEGDAEGEIDVQTAIGMSGTAARRASGFTLNMPPVRKTSNPLGDGRMLQ